jgi:glucokinase
MLIVAGDTGGTKTNVALFDSQRRSTDGRDAPALVEEATYPSARLAGLEDVLEDFLERTYAHHGGRIAAASFGVPGPVLDGRVETPNLPWIIVEDDLIERFGIPKVRLLNDLQATAAGVPALLHNELVTLQQGQPPRQLGAAAMLAPGTGIGVALLIPVDGLWQSQPTEGGHVDFAPRTDDEIGLLRFLQRHFPDHVSVERIVCGPGLLNIWRYVTTEVGVSCSEAERAAVEADPADAPRLIGECGLRGDCPACDMTLDLFASIFGAFAGNVALGSLAVSGIYLGGGITPKLLTRLQDGPFLRAFHAKGRFEAMMKRIPVVAVLNEETAVYGAARTAARLCGNTP